MLAVQGDGRDARRGKEQDERAMKGEEQALGAMLFSDGSFPLGDKAHYFLHLRGGQIGSSGS